MMVAPIVSNGTGCVRNFHAKQTWSLVFYLLQVVSQKKGHTFRREVNLKFETESIDVSAKSFFDLLRGAGCGIDLPQQGVGKALLLCLGPEWRLIKEKTNKGKSVLSTLPWYSGQNIFVNPVMKSYVSICVLTFPKFLEWDFQRQPPVLLLPSQRPTTRRRTVESRRLSPNNPRPWRS